MKAKTIHEIHICLYFLVVISMSGLSVWAYYESNFFISILSIIVEVYCWVKADEIQEIIRWW